MQPDLIDRANTVVALCARGMAVDAMPAAARRLFELAWVACRDDYEAAIAAHFVARHQGTAEETLHWNALAVRHAEAVSDGRTAGFLPSLYLNLGDAQANLGEIAAAAESVRCAAAHLASVAAGGYRDLLIRGICRLLHVWALSLKSKRS